MNRLVYLLLFLFSTFSFGVEAQGLCNNPNTIQNGFKLDANVGCHPFRVIPQDQSGLSDVKYIFDYRGQAASELSRLNPALQDVLFKGQNDQPKTYTILQYGKDANGVEKYSCQNVTVRATLKPIASFNVCNNTTVEVNIPATALNNHDSYKLDFGSGLETIPNSSLPFVKVINVPVGAEVSILGEYNNQSISCDAKLVFRNIAGASQNEGKIKVNYIKLTNRSEVEISFEGSYAPAGYKVFMSENGSTPNFSSAIKSGINPGVFSISLPDTNKSYCFTLTKEEICGGTEVSHDFCTTPILDVIHTGGNNEISWIPHTRLFYNQFLTLLFGNRSNTIRLDKKVLPNNQVSSRSIAASSPLNDPVNCEKEYCYTIVTKSDGILFGRAFNYESISNEVCINLDQISTPPIVNLMASYGDSNTEKVVEFEDDSNWPIERDKYFISSGIVNNQYLYLDSISSTERTFKLQNSIDTCFVIKFRDKCGVWSEESPKACTVNLSLNSEEQLNWSSINPFTATVVDFYEVYARNESSNIFEKIGDRSNAFQDFKPDLSTYVNEAVFRIKVISQNGQISWSNYLNIPLEFKLFIPEAFSPNGDGENDILELKGSLGRTENIYFEIYNRWGKLLFVSKDKDLKWDAMINGKALPMGQYIYTFHAELKDGSLLKQNGIIQILK